MSQRMWRHSEHGHFIDSQTSNTHGCHEVAVFPVSEGRELWGVWDSLNNVWEEEPHFESKYFASVWVDKYLPGTEKYELRHARVYIEPMEGEKK